MFKYLVTILIAILCFSQIESKKYGSNKKKEKLSLLNVKNVQLKKSDLKFLEKQHKVKTQMSLMEEDFQEGERICQAINKEPLQDFFVKFGLVTKIITDIGEFQDKMKKTSSSQAWERKKRYRLESFSGLTDKYFSKSSKRGFGKSRARSDPSYMAPCYGYNYLSAIDALSEDDDGKTGPDMLVIEELMAEMKDRKLTKKIDDIFVKCQQNTQNSELTCPEVDTESILKEKKKKIVRCPDTCVNDNQCATKELCCSNVCGGKTCYNPGLSSKYRSEDSKLAKCRNADRFFECVYSNVKIMDKCNS